MDFTMETGTITLLSQLEEGVLTLTLNRPEARNALSFDMLTALSKQLAAAEINNQVRVIVITGADKAFCSGGDVKGMAAEGDFNGASNSKDERIHLQRLIQRETAGRLFRMPKPTIAAVNGAAAGAGMSLAFASDNSRTLACFFVIIMRYLYVLFL